MSKQRDLERERAKTAWEAVHEIVDKQNSQDADMKAKAEKLLKEYASLAKSAPADIMSNGLGQTLAFWGAKSKEKEGKKENGYSKLLKDVTDWLTDERHRFDNKGNKLVEWIMSLDSMNQYRRATSEAIAFLIWVKRFAEAAEDE
jgi:CRISPR-associated protein Cmr5